MYLDKRIAAVSTLVPGLVSLAQSPFELDAYKSMCHSLGWIIDMDDWAPETFFGAWVRDPDFLFKVTIDRDESSAGLAVCAVGELEEPPGFFLPSRANLDREFTRVQQIVRASLGLPKKEGEYQSRLSSVRYHFAYWSYTNAFLVLIEHDEIEFSKNPSLELRLLPRLGDEGPAIPLNTNLLLC